jgi:hypothetical protein
MLSGISHVFIDEVHERGVLADFLLIILKDVIPKRSVASDACMVVPWQPKPSGFGNVDARGFFGSFPKNSDSHAGYFESTNASLIGGCFNLCRRFVFLPSWLTAAARQLYHAFMPR